MAQLLNTSIDGFISSPTFSNGFDGSGWKIWNYRTEEETKRYKLEIDDLVVRNTMTVFELLISKIRALKGAMAITQGNGKIKTVDNTDADYYIITVEDENSFVSNDFVRCQNFKGTAIRSYWVKIADIEGNNIYIAKSEFNTDMGNIVIPEIGDELVQFGNSLETERQSAIYLSADEYGVPCIDVLNGINSKSFDGCLKARFGCLDGITDSEFSNGVSGYGLYCENGFFKGTIAGADIYQLNKDGSGYLAGGAISWDVDGNITFSNDVTLNWSTDIDSINASVDTISSYVDSIMDDVSGINNNITTINSNLDTVNGTLNNINGNITLINANLGTIGGDVIGLQDEVVTINGKVGNKLTKIASDGIYTGTLAADQIISGKIDTSHINTTEILSNGNYWALNADGSGQLANSAITWDNAGNVSFSNDVKLNWSEDIFNLSDSVDNVISDVSGIQTNLFTINGEMDTINATIANQNSSITHINANLGTINGKVIGLEGDVVTIDGKIGNKLTYIGSEGIYTGTLAANQIISGKIDTSHINTAEILSNASKWSLNADGSGTLASGNITWNAAGDVTFSNNVKLNWSSDIDYLNGAIEDVLNNETALGNSITSINGNIDTVNASISSINGNIGTINSNINSIGSDIVGLQGNVVTINGTIGNKLTKIASDGIYTGTLAADQIVSGTITSSLINADELLSNSTKWALDSDGSGYLASGNVAWNTAGDLFVNGVISTPFETDTSLGAFGYGSFNAYKSPNIIKNVTQSFVNAVGSDNIYFYGNNIEYDGTVFRFYNQGVGLDFVPYTDADNSASKRTRFVGKYVTTFRVESGDYVEMIAAKDPADATRLMWIISTHF